MLCLYSLSDAYPFLHVAYSLASHLDCFWYLQAGDLACSLVIVDPPFGLQKHGKASDPLVVHNVIHDWDAKAWDAKAWNNVLSGLLRCSNVCSQFVVASYCAPQGVGTVSFMLLFCFAL